VAALLAMGLLAEHLTALQWAAIGCTVVASVGSTVTARRVAPTMPGSPA
jgi:inner membrane transporter RhtA